MHAEQNLPLMSDAGQGDPAARAYSLEWESGGSDVKGKGSQIILN